MATELLSKYKIEKKHRVIGAFALVYWLLSFWWERFAFYEGAAEARPVTHIVIKLLTLITVYLTALFFTNAVQGFKARGAAALAAMLLVQLAVYLPSAFDKEENGHRALPFFEYLITSMERNGLDKEKNAADLAIVNRYISVDAIHELNERQGDYNYNDNIIIYYGLVPGATDQDKVNFQNAVIRLIIHNPLVYIRSQIGAWLHISNAFQYERTLDYAANIFKNLYVPTAWLIGLWVYLLVKKQWCYWFITSGHLCHMAITTALLPAAYFKYYYSEYMYAALTATLAVCFLVKRHREKKSRTEA